MANTIVEHCNNVSFHDGIANIVPYFFMAMDNVMHGTTTKTTYQNKTMPINEKGYPIPIGNQGIFVILVKNFPLHNLECIELPIVTSQGNYSHGTRAIPINFILMRFVIVKPYVNIHVCLTT